VDARKAILSDDLEEIFFPQRIHIRCTAVKCLKWYLEPGADRKFRFEPDARNQAANDPRG
jgi:hypothetical protein